MKKKAAFQMSLGMIVALVFAVILLTGAIAWIQGTFQQITAITHQVTDSAKNQVINDIISDNKRVGIAAPAVTDWKKGETGSYTIVVNNIDPANDNSYTIGITRDSGPGTVDIGGWMTFPTSEVEVPAGQYNTFDIIIKPPTNTISGIYLFKVSVTEVGGIGVYGSDFFALEII